MSTTNTVKVPTSSEITEARKWIRANFPYGITPSHNPGQGLSILKFMEENFGPCDESWTYLDTEVLFKNLEDRVAFQLSWSNWENLE